MNHLDALNKMKSFWSNENLIFNSKRFPLQFIFIFQNKLSFSNYFILFTNKINLRKKNSFWHLNKLFIYFNESVICAPQYLKNKKKEKRKFKKKKTSATKIFIKWNASHIIIIFFFLKIFFEKENLRGEEQVVWNNI